jgi:2-polyprenyl-6-methoxyphenol hydroxylase-like FAD-dependent oxidoreductase
MGYFNFVSSPNDLNETPFLRFNYKTVSLFIVFSILNSMAYLIFVYLQIEGGTGHPGFICHKQPVMERCLRDVIAKQPTSEIRSGSTVQSISEDENYVYVMYTNAQGEEKKLRGKFLVGADGKTGYTRKHYLEPKGIKMEKSEKYTSLCPNYREKTN